MALAEPCGQIEDQRGGRPAPKTTQIRLLDRRAIGHRIGKRHPQLDHIRAAIDERVEDRCGIAIARGDEADERGAARKGGGEPAH